MRNRDLTKEGFAEQNTRSKKRMGLYRYCALLLWVSLTSLLPIVLSKEQLSSRECENLGFSGLALCSDCNTFSEYVKNQELVSDCLKCCTEDSDDSTSKITYSGALLEVCMRKLVFYPEIVGFLEEEKDKFPTVKVQYVFNSPPKMIMLDDEGQHKETIRIDNWKREHVLQFLREKVKPASY
ncbi:selenoprotein F [Ricinus communis]|nr:selenoprotein F [Ricinus communis]